MSDIAGWAVVRADASASVGTGHVVRSRTLADALAARGWTVTLASRSLPEALRSSWTDAGHGLLPLLPDLPIEGEPEALASLGERSPDLVIGDHYGLGPAWWERLSARLPGATRMAIEDNAGPPIAVDLLLDQNLGALAGPDRAAPSPGRHPPRILAGPGYSLVRPEFAERRATLRPRDGSIRRILVFLSGADVPDVTARAVRALAARSIPADIVVGAAYPHGARLRDLVADHPLLRLHVNTPRMADLMAEADLSIGAVSSATWERCTVGLPAVVITLADSQVVVERALVRAGAALAIGWHHEVTADDIGRAVDDLVADPVRVAAMARAAARVTDGLGTERVVAAIETAVLERTEER